MNITKTKLSKFAFCTALGGAFFAPAVAFAQAAAAPAAVPPAPAQPAPGGPGAASGPTPPAAVAPAPAPAVVTPVPGTETPPPPPPAVEPMPAPAAEAPPPPAPEEDKLPPIDVGAWLRVNMDFTGAGADSKKLNDQSMGVYGELHLGGKVHKNVSYTLNFNANGKGAAPGIMDAIIGLDFMDELHLWSGQLLTPVDRTNFSGPFFTTPWSYAGVMSAGGQLAIITPNGEWNSGRDVGSVLWGDIGKGTFKYYLALTHLAPQVASATVPGGGSPLISGRLAYAAIGKEPGYYGSSTYYGDQDILAFGVAAQSQKNGARSATGVDNYGEVNADVLAEFKMGEGGAITGEGAFYHYIGDNNPADNQFFILASYLSPLVGVGKLQPMVRYQMAKKKDIDAKSQIDVQLAYVVKGAAMRGILGYSHTDFGNGGVPGGEKLTGNLVQIGLQTIMF